MANVNVDLATLFRRINSLSLNSAKCIEEEMELDFYKTVLKTFCNDLTSKSVCTVFPIHFDICSKEKAREFALSLGMKIADGQCGRIYISYY